VYEKIAPPSSPATFVMGAVRQLPLNISLPTVVYRAEFGLLDLTSRQTSAEELCAYRDTIIQVNCFVLFLIGGCIVKYNFQRPWLQQRSDIKKYFSGCWSRTSGRMSV